MENHHRPVHIVLNIIALLVFILTCTFNLLSSRTDIGIFVSTQTALSDKYSLEVTPAGWTFSIWGLIYLWQFIWIVYSLILVCRTGPDGPLYVNPVLLSPLFFFIYILNLLLNISWLLVFDREMLEVAFVFLFLIAFTLYICMWLSYRALEQNKTVLALQNRKIDDILIRAFVHNGLGIYAAWTTIATFLNMGFVVAYRSSPTISQSTASSIVLAFIVVALVVFVGTDLTVFDKYTRYTITPYGVIIWALGGSIAKNFDAAKANSIFSVVLIGLGVVALIVKVVVVIIRSSSKPIFLSRTDVSAHEIRSVEKV